MLSYQQTPVEEIVDERLLEASVKLFVKREDLNHPLVSGNKWWKLKYNLIEAKEGKKETILTFGGAFSNHIYSTAAAAHELNLKCIGVIRGEEVLPHNLTLQSVSRMGMRLHYISREDYRRKTDDDLVQQFHRHFGDFYLIPEGGSNELAVRGVTEFARSIEGDYDYLCCPVGTGGTLAGLIRGLSGAKQILGFSSLKGGDFLNDTVSGLEQRYKNWNIITDYHFGGYAKSTPALEEFVSDFKSRHNIPLEFVYTGKMFWGIFDLVSKGFFKKGSSILAIHTGGIRAASGAFTIEG